jgi:hypothetical protein
MKTAISIQSRFFQKRIAWMFQKCNTPTIRFMTTFRPKYGWVKNQEDWRIKISHIGQSVVINYSIEEFANAIYKIKEDYIKEIEWCPLSVEDRKQRKESKRLEKYFKWIARKLERRGDY